MVNAPSIIAITGQACNGLHYLYAFDAAFHDFYPLQRHLIMIQFASYMNSCSLTSSKINFMIDDAPIDDFKK